MNIVFYCKPFDEIRKNYDFEHEGYFDILENFYQKLPKKLWTGRIGVYIKNVQEKKMYTACVKDFDKFANFSKVTDITMEKAIERAFRFFRVFCTEKEEKE